MVFKGNIFKFGKDVDTDVIIAARYLNIPDIGILSKYCMKDLDPEFTMKVKRGDLIFAEENFGCGSSREHAPLVIKEIGISCVVAKSFARIFYRNALNVGLPIMTCTEAIAYAKTGSEATIDTESGSIAIAGKKFKASPFSPFLLNIIELGGLMPYVKNRLQYVT